MIPLDCHDLVVNDQKLRVRAKRHPWIFAGALEGPSEPPTAPCLARVLDRDGSFVAWGTYSPTSKIAVRVCSWDPDTRPDEGFWAERIREAMGRRAPIAAQGTTALRLIYAEADGLPGLVVDRMGPVLVVQFLTPWMDQAREAMSALILDAAASVLRNMPPVSAVIERSDGDGRALEGLKDRSGILWGTLDQRDVPVTEDSLELWVNPRGQKTGFYADQRDNRRRFGAQAQGADVLDACTYTGAFACHAMAGGAKSLLIIDRSKESLDQAAKNLDHTRSTRAASLHPGGCPAESRQGDVFEELRRLVDQGRSFDLISLDPPKLAPNRRSLDRAALGYKDLNLQAMRLLRPGALLYTFSCSGLVALADLQLWCAWAARDLGLTLRIEGWLHQAACHPVPLAYPEAEYLKGLVLRREA